ncbi:phage tail assembly chaperone [Pseudoxanthomonas sp. PXM05]|uniref:phage tail assembly chaperone n=1 Tax=Pseudoxanthomonas sp. PXM05 TaxID=2854775 RepID=UPI001C4850F8|nr:phage tail assembly chaperone [Pseudoxanthomonas sp. PXM05]MBV7475398.1 phage tail assembly chaperone [Pseudoxanthomonas sp. PXM05]
MARLKLNPDPTFKSKVGVPVPGGRTAEVEFTFKYRSKSDLATWHDEVREMPADTPETELLRSFVLGWDLDDEFNDDNMRRLCDAYPGAAAAAMDVYLHESWGARRGN